MVNEADFSVTGFIATQPMKGHTKGGTPTLWMRVGWTPRVLDRRTGEWTDQLTSFVSVTCYRKIAEHGAQCLRRGDPIMLKGTLQVREFTDQAGVKRIVVEVVADNLSHDLSRGISNYTKAPKHLEQTAEEYSLSMGAERDPLPGDVAPIGAAEPDQPDPADLADLADLADSADFSEPPDREPEDEPVGAAV